MDQFDQVILWLAVGTEAAAALVIGLAAVEATGYAIYSFFRHVLKMHPLSSDGRDPREVIRLKFGRWLALSLEFALAADILRTTVAPTWNEIGQLAAIIMLRTALNFFLQREIEQAETKAAERRAARAPASANGA
ncbi:DUF1622 domain-containing protein [Pedomonas mirosovicensis]|uniref:DUF1622 domain-containing protein n=1 Tax=Pedomonas mirosovicensis TaxID=2908641 RepID=UPI002168F5C1|nr:DUF1622 domain-containing protein [Pedomonas mirosovicensis]MCH8684771.1 DUF1622 domain-containing protein [Pedomonas mirosovicensis]